MEAMKPTSVGGLRCGHRLTDPRLNLGIPYQIPPDVDDPSNNQEGSTISATTRWVFFLLLGMMLLIVFFQYSGTIDIFQYLTLLFTICFLLLSFLSLITAGKQLVVSRLQVSATRESVLASKDSLKASVAPSLIFRIRPANHYWSGPFGRQPDTWEAGVGIYIENIGLGHARDLKLSVKAVGDIEEQRCEAEWGRLRAGVTHTLPSKQYPQLEVKETHKQIVIESIEYDDIRTPPNHYTIDEPIILELNPDFFDERDKGKTDPLGPKMA